MQYYPTPKNLDLVVSSFGGVGTSFLIRFLSDFKKVNPVNDKGSLKHIHHPPISINPSQKFIYLFGNPIYATISLFRRNFHHLQSIKIQKASGMNSPIEPAMTLEEYASQGVDRFGFKEHFYNWYHAECPNPILFIRYETLHNHLWEILNYAELPLSALKTFPIREERHSNPEEIADETLKKLEQIYSEFLKELESIPDIEIHNGKELSRLESIRYQIVYTSANTWYGFKKILKEILPFKKNNPSNIE